MGLEDELSRVAYSKRSAPSRGPGYISVGTETPLLSSRFWFLVFLKFPISSSLLFIHLLLRSASLLESTEA